MDTVHVLMAYLALSTVEERESEREKVRDCRIDRERERECWEEVETKRSQNDDMRVTTHWITAT